MSVNNRVVVAAGKKRICDNHSFSITVVYYIVDYADCVFTIRHENGFLHFDCAEFVGVGWEG